MSLLQRIYDYLFTTARAKPVTVEDQARALVVAVDRGGIPLNPAKVNDIARRLGLEVRASAPVEETIGRIRAAVGRMSAG